MYIMTLVNSRSRGKLSEVRMGAVKKIEDASGSGGLDTID